MTAIVTMPAPGRFLRITDHDGSVRSVRMILEPLGLRWSKGEGTWVFPASPQRVASLSKLVPGIELHSSVKAWLTVQETVTRHKMGITAPRMPADYIPPVPPRQFQYAGTWWLRGNAGAMLLDEMGLGKTKQAIDAAMTLPHRVVVVCPKSLMIPWAEEIEKMGFGEVTVLDGPVADRISTATFWTQITSVSAELKRWLICNYEGARLMGQTFTDATKGSILILDEAHRAKNPRALITKLLFTCNPAYTWLLTGTPIANRLEDLWSLMHLVRPGMLGWKWWDFERRHIRRNKFNAIFAYNETDRIRAALEEVSLRRRKEECIDLPPKIFEKRVVELSPEEMGAYRMMRDRLEAWLREEQPDGSQQLTHTQALSFGAQFVRLRQIADGFVSDGVDKPPAWAKTTTKLANVVEVWEDAGRRRIVVWTSFIPVLRRLVETLQTMKVPVGCIHGGVSSARRAEVVEAFRNTEGMFLVGQIDAMGEGLNLQVADLQAYIDVPLTPRQRLQAVDRLHRIGQDRPVTIVDILAKGTLDIGLTRRLKEKEATAASIVDGETVASLSEMLHGR